MYIHRTARKKDIKEKRKEKYRNENRKRGR